MENKLTAKQKTQLVDDVAKYLIEHDLTTETTMYANGKRIRFEPFSDATAVTKAFGKYYVNDNDVRKR